MFRTQRWLGVVSLGLVLALMLPVLAAETARGTIKKVSAADKEVVVTDTNNKDMTFSVGVKTKIFHNDKAVKLQELKEGGEVTISYDKQNGTFIANEIRCQSKKE
jgi:Cu/Ag efflux protein CusF